MRRRYLVVEDHPVMFDVIRHGGAEHRSIC